MNKIKNWIRNHQVLTFFVLAYSITWTGLVLVFFIYPGVELVEGLAAPFTVYSPALVALVISAIALPKPKHKTSKSRWIAFFISWPLSAAVLILYGWKVQHIPFLTNLVYHSIWALLPAWMFASVYARNPGIRKQFSTLLKPRGPWRWYLVIFLIFPGVVLAACWITRLMGGEAEFYLADMLFWEAAVLLVLEFLRGFLTTGGINEESGWRGFALPRLQSRYPVLVAALIVGFLWSFWHIPYDIGKGVPTAWMLENRLLWNPIFAVMMTWLYNRTNGSLLAPALFHPAMNAFGNAFSITLVGKVLLISVAVMAIFSDRMWQKLPVDHKAVYQVQEPKNEISTIPMAAQHG
jgi:membrane protease YdiL (CAAX protease family)